MVLVTDSFIVSFIALFNLAVHVSAFPFALDASPSVPTVVNPPAWRSDSHGPEYTFNGLHSSATITDGVPPGYTPTAEPLVITVYPPGASNQANIRTVTITQPASTLTVQAPPHIYFTTVTETVTPSPSGVSIPTAATSTTSSALQSDPTTSRIPSNALEWVLPAQFTSIDQAFDINHFAYGRENVQLLDSSIASSGDSSAFSSTGTIMQVVYPQGSYSPSHEPRGGADFYATPAFSSSSVTNSISSGDIPSIQRANNVTFSYSVYFPLTFDFVKGGKLPGLYGGHEKCSGGDDGLGCFSTRLMWRTGGKGELYLYAPKNLQVASLCETPPRSICDSAYGLSIGRGSFTFKRGGWTHVSQTVWLNTPGLADGGFVLEISSDNDYQAKAVLSSGEVLYRDTSIVDDGIGSSSIDDLYSEDDEPTQVTYDAPDVWNPLGNLVSGSAASDDQLFEVENLEDPWLDALDMSSWNNLASLPIQKGVENGKVARSLWREHIRRNFASRHRVEKPPLLSILPRLASASVPLATSSDISTAAPALDTPASSSSTASAATVFVVEGTSTLTMPNYNTATSTVTYTTTNTVAATTTSAVSPSASELVDSPAHDAVGFIGIFFSTFFGGSTPDWASPRDQTACFKDFRVVINA